MIIQNSNLTSGASRQYRSSATQQTRYTVWNNNTRTTANVMNRTSNHIAENTVSKNGELIDESQLMDDTSVSYEQGSLPVSETNEQEEESIIRNELNTFMEQFQSKRSVRIRPLEERIEEIRKMQQESIHYLLELLFGKKNASPKQFASLQDEAAADATAIAETDFPAASGNKETEPSIGGTYESFYYYEEHETTCFDTMGTAVTADGRKLSFRISLEMSRSFTEMASTQIDFGEPRLCDPLVINLNMNAASVSDQKFFFDIDADGQKDEISMLNPGSGYLSLDKNNDGAINDGSELFGTKSGNGFQDLREYDSDGNGWIDEADEIFRKLKIWTMDEDGNSTLVDLKKAGVGAIYLGYENTDFSLMDAKNNVNAMIRKTGIFLYENGYSGTVQQLDLAT
uniref:hypothetical protein n=1 Tax=Agathobacter sp. TaxID=2021311 RepID=UPI00405656C3